MNVFCTALMTTLLQVGSAHAIDLDYKNCSSADKIAIRDAVVVEEQCLEARRENGQEQVDELSAGKSRNKFVKKLDKKLEFVCKNDSKKCQPNEDGTFFFRPKLFRFLSMNNPAPAPELSGHQRHFVEHYRP